MNENVLLSLGKEYKINAVKIEEYRNIKVKMIYVELKTKKARCPLCNEFTKNKHDMLKEMKIKYTKMAEYESYIVIRKRRFKCKKCNKIFTEELYLNEKGTNISNCLKQKILKDLKQMRSIKEIAEDNGITDNEVRRIFDEYMGEDIHPKYLPRVISMDEFAADTKVGKYAYILNDPIHKKTLDILPSRKKEYLIDYFCKVKNRYSVEYVISDMYDTYYQVTTLLFPKAKYVVDPFHYTRCVTEALDDIRKRLQKQYDTKSREYYVLKNKRNCDFIKSVL